MPVMHNSPEWLKLNETVTRTETKVDSLEKALEHLANRQALQHKENTLRMDAIEVKAGELNDKVEEIYRVIARVEGAFEGARSIGKLIAWLLGVVIALQTLYVFFGPTIRRNVGLPNAVVQPQTQGEVLNHAPQSAHIPNLN